MSAFLKKGLLIRPSIKLSQRMARIQKDSIVEYTKELGSNFPDRWEDFAPLCDINTTDGIVKFKPYDYQKEIVAQIEESVTTQICKTRQLGVTETILNYFLWKAIKKRGYKAAVFSKGQEDTAEFSIRLRFTLAGLQIPVNSDSTKNLHIRNGGAIYYRNSTIHGSRSLAGVSDLLYDESAFVEEIKKIYSASVPTVTTAKDPKIIILSTPNGKNNWFFDQLVKGNPEKDILQICKAIREGDLDPFLFWKDSEGKTKIFVHWKEHPIFGKEEDYLERIQRTTGLSRQAVEQEYNLNFEEAESIVFKYDLLDRVFVGDYKQKYEPEKYNYYAGLDVAGDGEDALVFTIIAECKTTLKLYLAEVYHTQESGFRKHIKEIKKLLQTYYPLAVGIEITGGEGSIYLETLEYDLPDYNYFAFRTTNATKQSAIDRLIYYFEKGKYILPANDKPMREEFVTFKREGKYLSAQRGKHDDRVMSLAIGTQAIIYHESL